MNNHGKLTSILSAAIQSCNPCQSWHGALSSEEALKIGADLVRQIFCYFEFHFRVMRIHLNDSG
jgi:hypothetical protein